MLSYEGRASYEMKTEKSSNGSMKALKMRRRNLMIIDPKASASIYLPLWGVCVCVYMHIFTTDLDSAESNAEMRISWWYLRYWFDVMCWKSDRKPVMFSWDKKKEENSSTSLSFTTSPSSSPPPSTSDLFFSEIDSQRVWMFF